MSGTQLLVEIAGWSGAVLILPAYLLLSMGRLTRQSALYQAMNVVGAAGFVINGGWHRAMPSASLNVVWDRSGGAVADPADTSRLSSKGNETDRGVDAMSGPCPAHGHSTSRERLNIWRACTAFERISRTAGEGGSEKARAAN